MNGINPSGVFAESYRPSARVSGIPENPSRRGFIHSTSATTGVSKSSRSSHTVERMASGKAVLSYLNQKHNFVFVATHDLELADLLKDSFQLFHFTEIVQRNTVVFDYKLNPGNLTNTNAI